MSSHRSFMALFLGLIAPIIIHSNDVHLSTNLTSSIVGRYSLVKCVSSLKHASSKKYIVTKDESNYYNTNIDIYSREDNALLRKIPNRTIPNNSTLELAITDDYVVSATIEDKGLWVDTLTDQSTNKNIRFPAAHSWGIKSLHIIPQQSHLVSCIHSSTLIIVDIEKGCINHTCAEDQSALKAIPNSTGNGFLFVHPKGPNISEYTASHYDVRSGQCTPLPITTREILPPLASNQNNTRYAIGDTYTVLLFDVTAGKQDHTITLPKERKTRCLFFADDSTIVYNTENINFNGERKHALETLSLQTNNPHRSPRPLDTQISILKFHQNTNVLVGTTERFGPGLILYDFSAKK